MKILAALFVSALLAAAAATPAQPKVKVMALADLPAPIQKSIQAGLNGATLGDINQVEDRGVITYDIAASTKDGQGRNFTLTAEGNLKHLEIPLADAPVDVQKVIKTQLGADTLVSINKTPTGDGIEYDVLAIMKNSQKRDFSIDSGAKLISQSVQLADTPAAVQATIKAQQHQARIDSIEESLGEGGPAYAVQFTSIYGVQRHFVADAAGKLESQQMTLVQTPALVQNAIQTEMADGKLENIEKIFNDGPITFEVDMTTKDGQSRDFSVNINGNLTRRQILPPEVPSVVQDTIRAHLGRNKLGRIEEELADDGNTFEVQMSMADGTTRDMSISATGQLESLQVVLTEASLGAQSAITKQLGQNKLIRIDKDFADDGHTYAVEMKTKDGTTRDFTVTDNGKLQSVEVTMAELSSDVQATIVTHVAAGKLASIEKIYDDTGIIYDVAVTNITGKIRSFTVDADGAFLGN